MPEFVVSSRAEGDIASAFDWYETCCPGLGGRFVLSLDAAFAAVQRNLVLFSTVKAAGKGFAERETLGGCAAGACEHADLQGDGNSGVLTAKNAEITKDRGRSLLAGEPCWKRRASARFLYPKH